MIMVLFIQVLLFSIAIFGGQTIQRLSAEHFNILDSRVLLRKNYIEDEMFRYRSGLTGFEKYIQQEVKALGIENDLSLIPKLLENVIDPMVVTLRQSRATEIFIILEGEKNHEGIHLRDLDPSFNAIDNSDILFERGPVDMARKIGVSLDSQWAHNFQLSKEDEASDFYYKPYLAAKSYSHMGAQDLGYWSSPFRLSQNDIEIITHSIPLINEDGEPYGVIGVGLTVDYLSKKLHYDELAKNKQGAYLLSMSNKEEKTFRKIVSSGPMYKRLVGTQTNLLEKKGHKNIYIVEGNEKIAGDVYASVQDLSLYNVNTPFEHDQWSLTGLIKKNTLFQPIKKIERSIFISLFISLFLGILVTYVVARWFMEPMNDLMEKVEKSSPSNPFVRTKTNILEIDELGFAIETLNNKVAASGSKLSQIISMVKVPIGAFEYISHEEKVFCTNTLFNVLGIQKEESINYIKTSDFKAIINRVKEKPEVDFQDVYRYEKEKGKTCWIRLITQELDGKTLGVIEDVTEDIIWKRRLEYERDHDTLTQLFNRRAFEALARRKMKEECLDHCAFVMWDLDNLKYINDTYGHDFGDRYIQKAASVLNEFTIYNAIVGRMSGDEFYTFIYGYTNKEKIKQRIQEIHASLYNTLLTMPDEETVRIRASAGIAWYPDDSTDYHELVRYADFAMYEMKNKDKGNIGEFNRDTYKRDSILLHGKEELNHFIDQELVKYAFQPIVDVKTGDIFAYEALMRPQTKKLSSPLDVIRLAQSQSKLYEIEKLTLFKTMEAFEKHKDHFGDAKIFINSIPNYVLSNKDIAIFEERFTNYLNRIVIEITEYEQSHEECTRIKQETIARWGSHLALDDFGSGYNSEIALLILSPKFIKIDMSIVRGIDIDENRQKLLSNIISYAQNRKIKIIAEGIESKAEMNTLIEFGVDYMQGYYLGRPQFIPQQLNPKIKQLIRG